MFSRGQVIPALNLRARFGFEKIPYDLRTRLVVVSSGGRTIGLIVDTAREFVRIPAGTIAAAARSDYRARAGSYLEGIATIDERMILVLNLREVIDIGEQQPVVWSRRSTRRRSWQHRLNGRGRGDERGRRARTVRRRRRRR